MSTHPNGQLHRRVTPSIKSSDKVYFAGELAALCGAAYASASDQANLVFLFGSLLIFLIGLSLTGVSR